MASMIPNAALKALIDGTIDLDTDDIRAILVMTNTTADTERDTVKFVGDYTTLDECDASGYARVALQSEAVTADDSNDRAEFSASNFSFEGLSGGSSRPHQGVVLYKHVNDDEDSPILGYFDFDADVDEAATEVQVPVPAEGILQVAMAS